MEHCKKKKLRPLLGKSQWISFGESRLKLHHLNLLERPSRQNMVRNLNSYDKYNRKHTGKDIPTFVYYCVEGIIFE